MPTFPYPWMLGWLVLASAPIIIHLLNRRRFKVVEWAAMEFLLASDRKNYRRVRLEQLILLALRVLLIVILVLLIARPQAPRRALAGLAERQRFVLLVFDTSMSMGYREGSTASYDRGIAFAEQLMASLRQNDTWALVAVEGNGRTITPEPSFDFEAARAAIARDRLPLSDNDGSVPAALASAEEILAQVRTAGKDVYIVTDLQRSSWLGPAGAVAAEDVERLKRLSRAASVTLVDVGAEAPANFAVTALETESPLVVAGGETVIRARVANYGPDATSAVRVAFLVDGFRQQISEAKTIGSGESAQWEFRHVHRTGGPHALTAEIDPDNLPKDNRRFLALEVRDSIPILCVDGKPATDPFTGGSDLLRQALKPAGEGEAPAEPSSRADRVSLFEPEVTTPDGMAAAELPRYDAVALVDVPKLEPLVVASLERYVQEGGALLVFPGEKVDREFYNSALFRKGEGLLPCSLGEAVGDAVEKKQAVHLAADPGDHPFVRLFREHKAIQLSSPAFYRYYRLEDVDAKGKARVVCKFDNNAPAIVEAERGRGRVVVFASSADDEWNDMPSWPAYLALMQEILTQVARDPGLSRNVRVGEPLVRHLPPRLFGKTVRVLRPGESQPVQLQATAAGGLVAATYDKTDKAGIYEMAIDTDAPSGAGVPPASGAADRLERRQDFFAVNVPAGESDLRRISVDDLRKTYPGFEFDYQRGGRQIAASSAPQEGELWRSLAYALLTLVLLESVLAQRFGR